LSKEKLSVVNIIFVYIQTSKKSKKPMRAIAPDQKFEKRKEEEDHTRLFSRSCENNVTFDP
jgi:hypothetical protein